jgi:protein-disulfide isomerase
MRSNPALGPALADAAMRAHQAALEAAAGAGEASYDRAEALFRQARLQACRRQAEATLP